MAAGSITDSAVIGYLVTFRYRGALASFASAGECDWYVGSAPAYLAGVGASGVVQGGAAWLLAEMLLFFVPAVVAVVNYQELLLQQGWRIALVLLISTALVLGVTALAVDRLYCFEVWLSRRSRRHV